MAIIVQNKATYDFLEIQLDPGVETRIFRRRDSID